MKHLERGAVSWVGVTVIAIAALAIIGIGWIWHQGGIVATGPSQTASSAAGVPNTGTEATSTGYNFVIASSTPSATGASSVATQPTTETKTVTTYVKKTVAVPSTHSSALPSGMSGAVYHNSTYGLTLRLPSAGWSTYMTAGGPAGLPGTAEIHFVAPGESADAFVVNVWGKPGWNYVRTQENFVHLNTNDIGEGAYVGENFTWIYSANIYSHAAEAESALSSAVFY